MKIKKIHLKDFRRFTDLTIDLSELGKAPKLVLLIGPNGSGKSCVFDAFEAVNAYNKKHLDSNRPENEYYTKGDKDDFEVDIQYSRNGKEGGWKRKINYSNTSQIPKNAFYGRSSFRQIPEINKKSLGESKLGFEHDVDRPQKYIGRDQRFENDIGYIIEKLLNEIFGAPSDLTTGEIREKYIDPINEAFNRIFGLENGIALELIRFKPPLEGKPAEINFRKGQSEFHYNQLSAGEKEIFNILLNLLARSDYYQDTIYFFDEIDLHLNTSLQYRFLREITEHWIPENCQLWTASHSLGFIDYASDYNHAAILDFDELDFDQPQVLKPEPKDRFEIFEIAVSREHLDKLMQGKTIIFSENKDTVYFNELGLENIVFFRGNDKRDVFHKTLNMGEHYMGLVDRDYLTDQEIANIEATYSNLRILRYYSIENYLFHPENLKAYYEQQGKALNEQEYSEKIQSCKEAVRENIILRIQESRKAYPYFRDKKHENQRDKMMENADKIVEMLQSDDFETFYKVLPMKDYCTQLEERQNLYKRELAKTDWFKKQIEAIVKAQ